MNTKMIMTASAILMGGCGIVLTFAPEAIARVLHIPSNTTIILQILGALYFAFAMTNWTAKGNLLGGIYARPIAIGNLSHFIIAALALIKAYLTSELDWILLLGIAYTLFAILFSIIFMTHPIVKTVNQNSN
jgi:hypothetical protein